MASHGGNIAKRIAKNKRNGSRRPSPSGFHLVRYTSDGKCIRVGSMIGSGRVKRSTYRRASAVLECKCSHAAQDALYGRGRRVANLRFGSTWVPLDKTNPESRWTYACTVCGSNLVAKR